MAPVASVAAVAAAATPWRSAPARPWSGADASPDLNHEPTDEARPLMPLPARSETTPNNPPVAPSRPALPASSSVPPTPFQSPALKAVDRPSQFCMIEPPAPIRPPASRPMGVMRTRPISDAAAPPRLPPRPPPTAPRPAPSRPMTAPARPLPAPVTAPAPPQLQVQAREIGRAHV